MGAYIYRLTESLQVQLLLVNLELRDITMMYEQHKLAINILNPATSMGPTATVSYVLVFFFQQIYSIMDLPMTNKNAENWFYF